MLSPSPKAAASTLHRAAALALLALAAALGAGAGCAVIDAGKDCNSACETLNTCGLLSGGNCGAYCAGLVSGATIAGCVDQLDAQNQCAENITSCSTTADKASAATACSKTVQTFATCMAAYCKKTPGGQGCP
jgi:hypothetical protein